MSENITNKIRFEILKRDLYTCQYCGRKAPEVRLEVDHIVPRSSGGRTNLLNLITSCHECNSGKGKRPLDDNHLLEAQRKRWEELERCRKEIAEMARTEELVVTDLAEAWRRFTRYELTASGLEKLVLLVQQFEAKEVLTAMRVSADSYLRPNGNGSPTHESVQLAFSKIGGVCATTRRLPEKPYLGNLYYLRAIVRNRFHLDDDLIGVATSLLDGAFQRQTDYNVLLQYAKKEPYWSTWVKTMQEVIGDTVPPP